jgi:thioredoxin reductase (NADPH)
VYEKGAIGGLAAITDMVDNYPGFPDGIEGLTLAGYLEKQAERFGAHIEFGDVSALRTDGDIKVVTVDGTDVKAKTVLIATGSDYNKIGVPGEAEYYGRGVHYCATCDGAFYREKKLVVIGGGNSAVQEALFLTRFTSHIDLLVRSTIKASDVLQEDLQKFIDEGKITVHLKTTTQEIVAVDGKVTSVKATKDNVPVVFETDGVFVFVGLKPNTQFLAGSGIELDEQGLIKTNAHLETTISGVFASGDVRSGATMQIASAVGEGASAALSIREYIDEHK